MRQFGSGNHIVIICFRIVFYLFSYCELKLATCVNAEIALVNFTIFVQTMGVTVSEVFKNDFLIVSFRSSVQQLTRFIVWTLPTIVGTFGYLPISNISKLHLCTCL